MRSAWWVGVVALVGCASSRVQVLPQLTPVDASRPFFVYAPVQGTGCGDDAVARALEDLWRVAGDSHGFITAVVEEHEGAEGQPCATVTARPISYGCEAHPPVKLDVDPMHVVPGPTACAATPADACVDTCADFAKKLGAAEFQAAAVRERCVTRCRATDSAFLGCVAAAKTAADVRACDAH